MESLDHAIGKTCRACEEGVLELKNDVAKVEHHDQILEVPERYLECTVCGCVPAWTSLMKETLNNIKVAKAQHGHM